MFRKVAVAAVSVVLLAGVSSAQDYYAGAGVTMTSPVDTNLDLYTIDARFGRTINENFAIEGEVGFGFDRSYRGADVKIEYSLAAFAVGRLPVTEEITLLGRIGYIHAEVEASAFGFTAAESDDGIVYGAGAEYALSDVNSLRLDYSRFDSDFEADRLSFSFVRKFGG